jgi:hypothetical protein
VHNWMRDVGLPNVTVALLDRVPDEQIHEAERSWISRLRAEGFDLLNVAEGGLGRPGYRSPEEVARCAVAHIGVKHKKHEFADIQTQVVSGARGAHNRWHVARGLIKESCMFCKENT